MITRALIIADPWIDKILSGEKTLEMRTRHTKIRGTIGLIRKGSGLIVGKAELIGSHDLTGELENSHLRHCIDYASNPGLKKYCIGWELRNVTRYTAPIPYTHPLGAVIWVNTDRISQ